MLFSLTCARIHPSLFLFLFQTNIFSLTNFDQPAVRAQQVLSVETLLASSALAGDQIRDPFATDHKLDLAGLQALAPKLNWAALLKGIYLL